MLIIFYERFSLIVFSEVTGSRKKNAFAREQYCLVFMSSMVTWKDCGLKPRLSRKWKTELCERKVQQGSRDKDRSTSASECINKALIFCLSITYKNKEFIINPDDRMFFLFTTLLSIDDNKLRFLSQKARKAHYVL